MLQEKMERRAVGRRRYLLISGNKHHKFDCNCFACKRTGGYGNKYHKKNCKCSWCTKIFINKKGKEHPNWKGDSVGYSALHIYIRKYLGTPNICSICKIKTSKKYEWANISGLYKRDFKDWKRVCCKCHKKIDSNSFPKGEKVHTSKLKTSDVLKIRRLYKKNEYGVPKLAKQFKVKNFSIWSIVNRKSWKHI